LQDGKASPRVVPENSPNNSPVVAESLTWDKPKELKTELLPVKPLTPEMLPDRMRDYITDIAERMDDSSPDYVAVGVMVVLATLIGRKLAVMPKRYDPWLVVPNLWGAVIGRPSAKKTPSLTKAMAPLHQFESVEFEKHGVAMGKYLDQVKVAKVSLKANEKLLKGKIVKGEQEEGEKDFLKSLSLDPVQPPPCKRFIVNDATVEKLGELLGSNPMGVLLFRDELTGWLNTLDKPDRASDRAFYLECWSGTGSFTYDRIGRGTQRTERATLSLMGGIQPGKLIPYLAAQKEGKGDDGLIERFQLMVYPDPKPFRHVDRPPNEQATLMASQLFAQLNLLDGDLANPTIQKFGREAQALFDTWYDRNQKLVRSATLNPQLESHLAKYVSLLPSLALIIHAVDSSPGGNIGATSTQKAIAWCEYLESHARRVYALADGPIGSAKALQKRLNDMPNPFRIGAINSKNWHGLTTTDEIHEALDSLCEHGHLQKIVSGTTKRATDYFKHPKYC
ncbi:MAG: YfjI family protein, partial [Oceanospirillaceae bacterium]|nr:YfjI family protein [Oceanospirillaceae bacterium]